jgi:hypothetical protein
VTQGLAIEQQGMSLLSPIRIFFIFSNHTVEQLLQRYLAVLSTEGSEDNKVISTSLLALPMLKHALQASNRKESAALIDDTFMKQLLKIMFYGSCSPKLTCQFLQLINGMFIPYMYQE